MPDRIGKKCPLDMIELADIIDIVFSGHVPISDEPVKNTLAVGHRWLGVTKSGKSLTARESALRQNDDHSQDISGQAV